MAQRRQIRVSRSLEGGGERPATGYGEPEAGAHKLSHDRLTHVLRRPAQRAQHGEPECEEAEDAGHHHDGPADVVVERPGAGGEDGAPDHDRHHDPADDPVGTGRGGGRRHANVIDAPRADRGGLKTKAPGTVQAPGGRRT